MDRAAAGREGEYMTPQEKRAWLLRELPNSRETAQNRKTICRNFGLKTDDRSFREFASEVRNLKIPLIPAPGSHGLFYVADLTKFEDLMDFRLFVKAQRSTYETTAATVKALEELERETETWKPDASLFDCDITRKEWPDE